MRVLYLTDSLSDLDGVGRYTIRLVSALEELEPGLEVEVLLARKHRPTSSQVPAHWKVRIALPPDYFFHMSPTRFWPSVAVGSARIARAARGFDLVHAIKDYPHSLIGLIGARLARVPCISTAHGTYSVQPLHVKRHERLARWSYGKFNSVIAVSRYTAARLRERLDERELESSRLHAIPNAVDAQHYAAPRPVGAKPWHGKRFTLAIGELKERKGHHLGLEAWCRIATRFPDLEHVVIGKHSDADYLRSLTELCERAGVRGRVHFVGNVGEDEKVDLLQRAALFVHTPVTSKDGGFEGFGIVYLEAAACGTPCLGTLDSGAEDAIAHGDNGLLVAPNAQAVAEGLAAILGDRELARRMGERGRAIAASSSWEHNAKRVLALYRSAIAEGRR